MADGDFKFEKCLLKHFVRHQGWLPLCKKRAQALRKNAGNKRPRLKYFTFCAAGALDVMMLEMEKVLRRSASDMFDNVFFFDVNDTFVAQTRQRVPGAVGFPEEFVKVVLATDAEEKKSIGVIATLEPPKEKKFTNKVVDENRVLAIRREFVRSFPFDVINLDLERYLFIPREELPGDLVNALRNVFEWQRRPGVTKDGKKYSIDGFSLMFTLRLGPRDLGDDYQKLMKDYITSNIANDAGLEPLFKARSGDRSVTQFLREDFESFFKIAAPKTLMSLLHEQDWHVDPDHGVVAYEFERKTKKDPYRMLHVVMDVRRNDPPRERRGPGVESAAAKQAYAANVRRLFEHEAVAVAAKLKEFGENVISDHLEKVIAHRKKLSGD